MLKGSDVWKDVDGRPHLDRLPLQDRRAARIVGHAALQQEHCCQHIAPLQLQEAPGLQTAASTPTRQDTLGLPYMSFCRALHPAHSSTQDAIGSAHHHVSLAAII